MIETVMTREQWEREYEKRYIRERKRKINALKMMILQKTIGIIMFAFGFLFAYIFRDEDMSGALLLWLIGIVFALCPKQIIGIEHMGR